MGGIGTLDMRETLSTFGTFGILKILETRETHATVGDIQAFDNFVANRAHITILPSNYRRHRNLMMTYLLNSALKNNDEI